MQTASLLSALVYNDDKPKIELLMETLFSKEIRIVFKAGQIMKEHKAPGAIVVEIFEGCIDFGVQGIVHQIEKGDLLTLDPKVPHDLKAVQDSIVRLSLSKGDNINRVYKVLNE